MSLHEGQPLLHGGVDLRLASSVMIMVHGRGSGAADIMALSSQFPHPSLAFLAPEAEGRSWYPYSFLVPVQQNEPGISSAMTVIRSLVLESELTGVPRDRVFLLGFSQGACLVLEFAARNPTRYGGIFGLSGGLIGPPGTTWDSEESLQGTPVFIGCSDIDPQIPRSRVEESAEAIERLGGRVNMKIYPGLGHTISGAEIEAVGAVIGAGLG